MNDRELLELAAKAAGIEGELRKTIGGWDCIVRNNNPMTPWQPLHDDGDAMRLAVKLRLEVAVHETESGVINGNLIGWIEKHGDDPYAATRRAIVRVAAEIGKEQS